MADGVWFNWNRTSSGRVVSTMSHFWPLFPETCDLPMCRDCERAPRDPIDERELGESGA